MGLNIVVGYAGLLDLGYAAFFAIGAYTIGFLTSPGSVMVRNGWIPPFSRILAGPGRVLGGRGYFRGAPRCAYPPPAGDYLAIVTLGFGEIVPNFFLNATPLTNGTAGMNPSPSRRPWDRSASDRPISATGTG